MNSITKISTAIAFLSVGMLMAQKLETPAIPADAIVEKTHNHATTNPIDHAPIGVMGDHTHKKGEIMFSYRAMLMSMDGLLNGTDDIARTDTGYPINPESMTMQMHMLGAMYAPSDRVTLMLMANYKANDMDLFANPTGVSFTTNSSGFGDMKLGALVNLVDINNNKVHANIGLSIPTGSIDARDNTPLADNAILGYNMQIGSGTWDPSMGLTYTGKKGLFGWGAQTLFTFRTGTNDRDYGLGEKAEATAWASVKAVDFISFSTRLKYTFLGGITGADEEMNALMAPIFDTNNSGKKQLDLSLGSNVIIKSVKGLRAGLEVGLPVYQDLNGVQMKTEFAGTLGIQYAL